jgi:hypothetical protein
VRWTRSGTRLGTTAPVYHVRSADGGRRLACIVTLQTAGGTSVSASSASVLVPIPLAVLRAPRISGTPAVGATLACSAGAWRHSGTLRASYRWLRDGARLARATASRYRVEARDKGHRLACRVGVSAAGLQATRTTAAVRVA